MKLRLLILFVLSCFSCAAYAQIPTQPPAGGSPGGAAGGDLGGTFPNPTVVTSGGSVICTVAAPCTSASTLASAGHFHGSVTLTASASATVTVTGFVPTANGHCVISGENTDGATAVSKILNMGYGTNTMILTFTAPAVAGAKVAFMCDN